MYGRCYAVSKETDDPAGNRSFPEQDTQSHVHGNEPVKRNTHFVSQKLQYVEADEPLNGRLANHRQGIYDSQSVRMLSATYCPASAGLTGMQWQLF